MRGATWLIWAVLTRVAAADRLAVLDGAASVRMPDAGLTLVATAPASGEPLELLAADRELGCAPIERVAMRAPLVAYGAAPKLPRVVGGRALIYAAAVGLPDGAVDLLRFYIAAAEIERAAMWARRARAVAATLQLAQPPEPAPELVVAEVVDAARDHMPPPPAGWTLTHTGGSYQVASGRGGCRIIVGELDPVVSAPGNTTFQAGKLRSVDVYWALWRDEDGLRAETMVGAAKWGYVHARCSAAVSSERAAQIEYIEKLWPTE